MTLKEKISILMKGSGKKFGVYLHFMDLPGSSVPLTKNYYSFDEAINLIENYSPKLRDEEFMSIDYIGLEIEINTTTTTNDIDFIIPPITTICFQNGRYCPAHCMDEFLDTCIYIF